MTVVGIKVLKNKLSEYVRLASQGETVLVTDRGTVVAELSAPRAGRSPVVSDALLADLVRKGWLTPPARRSDRPPESLPVAPLSDVLAGLDGDREDRC
jgi:prevent-host-death family protein